LMGKEKECGDEEKGEGIQGLGGVRV
jgi:hypothetical protein